MRLAAGVLASLALAACGTEQGEAERPRPREEPPARSAVRAVSPVALPRLPAQGLLVRTEDGRDTLLVGLDGTVFGRLEGFRVGVGADGAGLLGTSGFAVPPAWPLLVDGQQRVYLLDAGARRLRRIDPTVTPLAQGAVVAREAGVWTVRRGGRVLSRFDGWPQTVSASLDVIGDGSRFVDVRTGRRFTLRRHCQAVWAERTGYDGLCGVASALTAATWAAPSPDGRHLLMQVPHACSATYAVIAPIDDLDAARTADGAREFGGPYSDALGWSRDGRAVVYLHAAPEEHAEGCSGARAGVYLVDPDTLDRALVVSGSGVMWGAFP